MKKLLLMSALSLWAVIAATAQISFMPQITEPVPSIMDEIDSLARVHTDTVVYMGGMPHDLMMPAVYDRFEFIDSVPLNRPDYSGKPYMRWLETLNAQSRIIKEYRQHLFFQHPELVRYNLSMLPEAPKPYTTVINPADYSITIVPMEIEAPAETTIKVEEIKKRHWLRTFQAGIQFSQAYISPNWYQGGNNNLNAIGNLYYNVKLNQALHPNLLFETTAQYKLGANSTPDDSIHSYSISEDLFQVNTTFGIKAAKRWYYSVTGLFKTQLLTSYNSNSHNVRASFMSPGELTLGLGMTYNYANPKKTFTFDMNVSPVSYHLMICTSDRINPTQYNIKAGKKCANQFGSNAEFKLFWQIAYNISFKSRLVTFSDYHYFQADWENTVNFDINRFLSTQLYVYARYDSSTPPVADSKWHKLQLKEILSLGFTYKFSTL